MRKDTKQFEIRYFSIEGCKKPLKNLLSQPASSDILDSSGDNAYSVASVKSKSNGVIACINKIRLSNWPRVGKRRQRTDRFLKLQKDEGLIEKCYFAINYSTGIMVVQKNGNACHIATVPRTLAALAKCDANDIVSIPSNRLLEDMDRPLSFTLSFSSLGNLPAALEAASKKTLVSEITSIASLMQADSSQSLSFSISAGRNVKSRETFPEPKMLNKTIDLLQKWGVVKKARVLVLDDEDKRLLIDILDDPKKRAVTVKMKGKYPDEGDMVQEIWECVQK